MHTDTLILILLITEQTHIIYNNMNHEEELEDFYEDYEQSSVGKLKMLIDGFSFDNLEYNGLETFEIKPILSKNEGIVITNIKDTKKNNNKNLF